MIGINRLLKQLEHANYHIRYKVIDQLGGIHSNEALTALLQALADKSEDDVDCKVNFHAVVALKRMGDFSLIPLIDALKPDPNHPEDEWRRYWVTRALGIHPSDNVIEPLFNLFKYEKSRTVIGGALTALSSKYEANGFGHFKDNVVDALKWYYQSVRSHEEDRYLEKLEKIIAKWERGKPKEEETQASLDETPRGENRLISFIKRIFKGYR